MKTDRFTTVLLAGLLLAAGLPAAGQISLRLGGATFTYEPSSKKLAKALAEKTKEVQQRFGADRRALRTVPGPGGEPAYLAQEVAGLITRTGEDLDQAIAQIGEPGLEGLRAWSAEEIRRIQAEITASPVQSAALPSGLSGPRAVAVVASLSAAVSQQETVPAATSDRLLDQLGKAVDRIFFLAAHDDLEVKLWVGSTPAEKATFRFWTQGQVQGSTPAPTIIQTNGKRDHVLRGLYRYRATYTDGAVTELIAYPNPAGAPAAQVASERLDLVNGSGFFCCRFSEQYCHHVTDEKECRP